MKKTLLAIAVLGAFVGAAQAQSSVTLSGAVDLGIRRQNGAYNMSNAGSSRTNVSLSGTEDLGGGMSAFFYMNHRFNLNTGAQRDANAFWRQGWVGLKGGFGNVRLGKMLPPLQVVNGDFDPFGTDTVGSVHTGGFLAGVPAYGSRYANAIYYTTPSLGGLTGHAMIAAADNNSSTGTTATALNNNGTKRPTGFAADYAAGPLRVSFAYDKNADALKTTGFYGSYNAGFATFMGQYEKGDVSTSTSLKRWSLGASVPFGAATFKAGYTKWTDEDVKKLGLGLWYSMSKRTTLYTDMGKTSGNGASTNAKKTQFDVGVNHKF
ncbi:MAG: porin [Burkholderiaceae bacterium]|nr:porin [Burkholderiaceae bacterium]MDH5328727.1 porin [Aquincola sp.]